MAEYIEPQITDLGNLADLTLASGALGDEDGAGKRVHANVPDVITASVGVFP